MFVGISVLYIFAVAKKQALYIQNQGEVGEWLKPAVC